MKKTLLTGIAALFLWQTGTAHAINVWSMKCGNVRIDGEIVKDEIWRKGGGAGYSLTITGLDGNGLHIDGLRVRQKKDGETYVNGKRCVPCFYGDCSKEGLKKERERKCGDLECE